MLVVQTVVHRVLHVQLPISCEETSTGIVAGSINLKVLVVLKLLLCTIANELLVLLKLFLRTTVEAVGLK